MSRERAASPRWRRAAGALAIAASLARPAIAHPASGEIVLDENLMSITGTFSDLRWDDRESRPAGAEVRILVSDCGRFQAVVQFAEGRAETSGLSRAVVADMTSPDGLVPLGVARPPLLARESWYDAWFTLPPGSGFAADGYGVVLADRLELVLDFADGREERYSLPRVARGFFEDDACGGKAPTPRAR